MWVRVSADDDDGDDDLDLGLDWVAAKVPGLRLVQTGEVGPLWVVTAGWWCWVLANRGGVKASDLDMDSSGHRLFSEDRDCCRSGYNGSNPLVDWDFQTPPG